MRRTPLRRKAPLTRRVPTRSPHAPAKPRRLPDPGGNSWREKRAVLLARAGGRCERCGVPVVFETFQAHHRKLRSQGGGHELSNLTCLCPGCHTTAHAGPLAAQAGGWIVPSHGHPVSRPVHLWDGRLVLLTPDGGYEDLFDEKGNPA